MDRSKSRIAAIMLSALACSGASKADTRALSTAGKILTALGAVVGATEIYNEVSAVVSKKQGKEPKWCTGRYSFYNLLSNSKKKSDEKPEEKPEKNQTFKCRQHPSGTCRRIVNPVRIRNGTATVFVEAPRAAKAGHWTPV